MMRAAVIALLVAVAVLAWREQRLHREIARLEERTQSLDNKVALVEHQTRSTFRQEDDWIMKALRDSQKDETIDRAQTAFALGQYENAIEVALSAVDPDEHVSVAPRRVWRIILASTCALKQAERARAYALNPLGRTAAHDQLVVYVCAKNHIVLPEPNLGLRAR